MAKTLYQKLFDHHVVEEREDGTALLYIDRHLVHEVTSPQAFAGLLKRGRGVRRPDLTLATSDHNVPTTSRASFTDTNSFIKDNESRVQCLTLESNSKKHGVKHFGIGSRHQGIVHVIGPELGFTLPGLTVVCGDSHTSTNGAFGALAFGIGTTEVEHVLATQTLVQHRSKNMRVQVEGLLNDSITSKDLILHIIGTIGTAGGTGTVIEFAGSTIERLSMESRMSLCNMSIEAGAKAGLVAPDETTFRYVKGRPFAPSPDSPSWHSALAHWSTMKSDKDAKFDRDIHIKAEEVVPMVTWGTSPEQVISITGSVPSPDDFANPEKQESCRRALHYMGLSAGTSMQDIVIDKVFLGSCTNARIEDLRSAARILKGKKISSSLKLALVVPGSVMTKRMAEAEGLDTTFRSAGFQWRESGCSLCVGLSEDMLLPFERCASTSNRNFEGRQGTSGRTHLVSPAMAAASAIQGRLADARSESTSRLDLPKVELDYGILDFGNDPGDLVASGDPDHEFAPPDRNGHPGQVSQTGFTEHEGRIAPMDLSNIDTDCIMPKQFCKTITREGLGKGLFHNLRYDEQGTPRADFVLNKEAYRDATILLATGRNFGCGSSREHAVWALQDYGFQCVLAPSFADIFYNNAFKNGLLLVTVQPGPLLKRVTEEARARRKILVNLVSQKILDSNGAELGDFKVDENRRRNLLFGLDELATTLQREAQIKSFEEKRQSQWPWVEDTVKLLSNEKHNKGHSTGYSKTLSIETNEKSRLEW